MDQRTEPSSLLNSRTVVPVLGAFSLPETVLSHGWYQVPPFAWDRASGVLTRCDPEGVLSVSQGADGVLEVLHEARDPGAPERLAVLLNLSFDLTEFHDLCRTHPTLSWVPQRGAGRFLRGRDAWEDASKGICGTNVGWSQAVRSMKRLADAGTDGCWPSPEELLARGEDWIRDHGRVGYRARYLSALAAGFVAQEFARDEASKHGFQAMPGIGPATARYLAGLRGDWREIAYDSSIAWLLREAHGLDRPSAEHADRLYSTFGVYRGLACLLDLHECHRRKRLES